jgi:uncharacterized DUF497 family protein
MDYEWDPIKAQSNREKHGVRFADAIAVLEDPFALTIPDHHADEQRFITIGEDAFGQILVVVLTYRGETSIRIISVRLYPSVPLRRRRPGHRSGE